METLAQCFKVNIGPHFAIDKAIRNEKKYFESLTTWQKLKIWSIVFLASLLPFTLYTTDVSTDSILVVEYSENGPDQKCDVFTTNCTIDEMILDKLAEIPSELSREACFNYSLAFILFPIISFAMEWNSYNRDMLKKEVTFHSAL